MTDTKERDRRVMDVVHALDRLRARPSTFRSDEVREIALNAQDEIKALLSDVRGWERSAEPDPLADRLISKVVHP